MASTKIAVLVPQNQARWPLSHSLAGVGGAEDHLVAVLGLHLHQPREAGLSVLLLRARISPASESPAAALVSV